MTQKRKQRVIHWPGDEPNAAGAVKLYPPLYNRVRAACGQLAPVQQVTTNDRRVTCGHCLKTQQYGEAR